MLWPWKPHAQITLLCTAGIGLVDGALAAAHLKPAIGNARPLQMWHQWGASKTAELPLWGKGWKSPQDLVGSKGKLYPQYMLASTAERLIYWTLGGQLMVLWGNVLLLFTQVILKLFTETVGMTTSQIQWWHFHFMAGELRHEVGILVSIFSV